MTEKRFSVVLMSEDGRRVGESHPRAKLTDRQVDLIRDLNEEYGFGYKRIAYLFKVSRDTIRQICTYRRRNTTVCSRKRVLVDSE